MREEDYRSFEHFEKNFSLSDSALDMRSLIRWNGRDIPEKENLSEHTHHVMCLTFELIDEYKELGINYSSDSIVRMIKCAMLHDVSELYFGDILASTKNTYPAIRDLVDSQERRFMMRQIPGLTGEEQALVNIADKKSCSQFLMKLLSSRYCNEYIKSLYNNSKKWVREARDAYEMLVGVKTTYDIPQEPISRLQKGYDADAGTDIILDHDVEFLPHSTTEVSLNWNYNPVEGQMGILLLRSSAGKKGLAINTSPIDPGFEGNTTAIIHNHSDEIIRYKRGESFCQLVVLPFVNVDAPVRKEGTRGSGKYGSSGAVGGNND